MRFGARCSAWVIVGFVAGCARVVDPNLETDAREDVTDAALDVAPRCPTAAASRFVDDVFDRDLSRWNRFAVGTPPTFAVENGWLRITDASLADTPSRDNTRSWIYDPAVDHGNQMWLDAPVADRDFTLAFSIRWASEIAELTLAGLGLSTRDGALQLYAGFVDPWSSRVGTPFVRVRGATGIVEWYGDEAATGSASFVIERANGRITARVDGRMMLSAEARQSLDELAVFSVRHRDAIATYDFGTVEIGDVALCF